MGGRTDTEFWRYISSGATKTDFVTDIIEMSKTRMPDTNDFPKYFGSAGWPLYSYVLAGIGLLTPEVALKELKNLSDEQLRHVVNDFQQFSGALRMNDPQLHSVDEFVAYFRKLRKDRGLGN
jgi:hypothetical protein